METKTQFAVLRTRIVPVDGSLIEDYDEYLDLHFKGELVKPGTPILVKWDDYEAWAVYVGGGYVHDHTPDHYQGNVDIFYYDQNNELGPDCVDLDQIVSVGAGPIVIPEG